MIEDRGTGQVEDSSNESGHTGVSQSFAVDTSLRALAGRLARAGSRKTIMTRVRPEVKPSSVPNTCDSLESRDTSPSFSLISVFSNKASEILHRAAEKGMIVFIFKPDSQKLIKGIPLIGQSSSNFLITPVSEKGGFCRNITIDVADHIIYGPPPSVDPKSLISAVRARISVATGESYPADKDSSPTPTSQKTPSKLAKRGLGIGGFLCSIEATDDNEVNKRMNALLSRDKAYMEDVAAILAQKDSVFADFFSNFVGTKKRWRLTNLPKFLQKGIKAKNPETKDLKTATSLFIPYLNVTLRQCIPTARTKAAGLTKNDSGLPVKININNCEAELDIQILEEGTEKRTPSAQQSHKLRDLHRHKITGLVDKISGDENQMLVDAMAFAYFGVPLSDLEILFQDKNIHERIENLNKQLEKHGFILYVNNGITIITEAKKPVHVMSAHLADGQNYDARFKNHLKTGSDDKVAMTSLHRAAMDAYKTFAKSEMKKAKGEFAKKGHEKRTQQGIEDYLHTMSEVGSCAEDIAKRIAAITSRPQHGTDQDSDISAAEYVFEVLNTKSPNASARKVHDEAKRLAESFRMSDKKNSSYKNGEILLRALIHQYHGVSITEAHKLPFTFNVDKDRNLQDVISKTNSSIEKDGISIHELNGFLVLAKTEEVSAERGEIRRKVFLIANRLTRPFRSTLKNMIAKTSN